MISPEEEKAEALRQKEREEKEQKLRNARRMLEERIEEGRLQSFRPRSR